MQVLQIDSPDTDSTSTVSPFDGANRFCDDVRKRVGEVVVGQDAVVERILIALFTGGHLMLQGVPGLAKTLLVNAVAKAISLQFSRIQFTIDLLPSDIVGSEILDQKTGEFRVQKGPVFANLLLADEINRAAPKAQSAMLEAMQERKVTIGGETFKLPTPFLVIATQSASIADLVRAMEAVQKVQVSDVFMKHLVELVRRTRESRLLDFGCSPRACLALAAAARARAFIHDRDYVVPEDLFELAEDVMLHRIRLTYEAAAEGHNGCEVIESILTDLG
jgi:MoxR-like ATPase